MLIKDGLVSLTRSSNSQAPVKSRLQSNCGSEVIRIDRMLPHATPGYLSAKEAYLNVPALSRAATPKLYHARTAFGHFLHTLCTPSMARISGILLLHAWNKFACNTEQAKSHAGHAARLLTGLNGGFSGWKFSNISLLSSFIALLDSAYEEARAPNSS